MKGLLFILLLMTYSSGIFATAAGKQVKLRIMGEDNRYDQTTIYFDYGISPAYNVHEDVVKSMSSIPEVPNIYSLTSDSVRCSTNGYSSLAENAIIGIGLKLNSTNAYTFYLQQFNNMDSSNIVILEDRQLHIFTEMQANFYSVQLTPDDTTGRFFLHITRPLQLSAQATGCVNNTGVISVMADGNILWNAVTLVGSNGAPIKTYNNVQGQFTFNDLAEGNYKLAFNYEGYLFTEPVFVAGEYVTVDFTASTQNVAVGQDINFTSTATNATDYTWWFGDSTIETGVANPTYFYYKPGVYTVTLVCSNSFGCTAETQMVITVTEPTGELSPNVNRISVINLGSKTLEVLLAEALLGNAEMQVHDILGQLVYQSAVTAKVMQISLTGHPTGIYLVSVKKDGKYTTVKFCLGN